MLKGTVPGDDGRPANEVGVWTKDKHQILRNYVGVTSAVRNKFLKGNSKSATYIDLYCATGRAMIRETGEFIDGSSLIAWKESCRKNAPFSEVIVADIDVEAIEYCRTRLENVSAPVRTFVGPAHCTVHEICDVLNPYGYHFVFIDPFSLGALPFSVIEKLCKVKSLDLLIHFSSSDLQRNFGHFLAGKQEGLDVFAPGWRNSVPQNEKEHVQRRKVFDYWRELIGTTGKWTANGIEHITGSNNQSLYWLVLASGNKMAAELWDKVRNISPQQGMFD